MDEAVAWGVIGYEYQMIQALHLYVSEEPPEKLNEHVHMAVVESLALHTRNVCDFLLNHGKGNAITLAGLVPKFSPPIQKKLGKAYESPLPDGRPSPINQFSKLVMHCTTERTLSGDYTDAFNLLWPTMSEFLIEVQQELRRRQNPE